MNYSEYYKEVNAIAGALVAEAMVDHNNDSEQAMDDITDCRLHETIDGHEWIIYNSYNLGIIEYSYNTDYMMDNLGLDHAAETLEKNGLNGLHQSIAYWALYADVAELLEDKMEEYVNELDN